MDTLISNVTAVTMNPRMEVIFGAYIGIDGGKIVSISKSAPAQPPKTIIDGTGMGAIPLSTATPTSPPPGFAVTPMI